MPDITMCTNLDCPMSNECYRSRAAPTEGSQSFAHFEPISPTECENFMEIWKRENRK